MYIQKLREWNNTSACEL